jgi:hypothetical protein
MTFACLTWSSSPARGGSTWTYLVPADTDTSVPFLCRAVHWSVFFISPNLLCHAQLRDIKGNVASSQLQMSLRCVQTLSRVETMLVLASPVRGRSQTVGPSVRSRRQHDPASIFGDMFQPSSSPTTEDHMGSRWRGGRD